MDERSDGGGGEKMEEIMLPGFRFHPTDEELVGFYLKRKIQQRPLTIELIKQLDIYKFDPWDLPKLATTGEKEWYFYCPRDRKYRNSARPNRVTGAGFWKATGTDRPIYSSEGSKCIGLKKSLVFYKGRAAKGVKTDWMMHEFRLPSLTDSNSKRFLDKTIPANDSWAICRIFKKTNSTAQRALSQSWVSPSPRTSTDQHNIMASSYTTKPNVNVTHILDPFSSYTNKSNIINPILPSPYLPQSTIDLSTSTYMFSHLDQPSAPPRCSVDVSTMLLNMSSSVLGDQYVDHQLGGSSYASSQDHNNNNGLISLMSSLAPQQRDHGSPEEMIDISGGVMKMRSNEQPWIGFPMNTLPLVSGHEAWKSSLVWEASPCPSEMSTTKCYT